MALADRQARPVRYLRLSLTDRCNLRCTYCMPPEGVVSSHRSEMLDFDEIEALVRAFAAAGLERLRLTGGEPTVRRDVVELVRRLCRLERRDGSLLPVVMTTNGIRMAELARPLRDAGLRGVTVSIDSLRPERFAEVTRRDELSRVIEGVRACRRAEFAHLKINTVAIEGFNGDEFADLARFAWEHGAIARFIELMPMSEGRVYAPGRSVSAATIRQRVAQALGADLEPLAGAGSANSPGGGMGPARYWRLATGRHAGRVFGTIAAMTENFCDSCNRIRVTARGELHACLANDDAVDLRSALRSNDGAALARAVARALGNKLDQHGFERDGTGGPSKSMTSIGG